MLGCATRERGGPVGLADAAPVAADGGASTVVPGRLSLVAHRGWQTAVLHRPGVPPERLFNLVEVTVSNGTGEPARLASPLFSLMTVSGLSFPGHASTAAVEGGCPADATLTTGNAVTCVVAFELGASAIATEIHYAPPGVSPETRIAVRLGIMWCPCFRERAGPACTAVARP